MKSKINEDSLSSQDLVNTILSHVPSLGSRYTHDPEGFNDAVMSMAIAYLESLEESDKENESSKSYEAGSSLCV